MRLLRLSSICLGLFLSTQLHWGCASRGPVTIHQDRGPYTNALGNTDQQELLANIVRVAYLEAPMFLQVASVTSSPSFEYGSDTEAKLGDGSEPSPLLPLRARVGYRDSPTIFYRPLQGREFSNQLLVPFDLRPVFIMLDNGFDFGVVGPLLFKSMNRLSNSRYSTREERAAFRRTADAIARMIRKGHIRLGTSSEALRATAGKMYAIFSPHAFSTEDGEVVASSLELDRSQTTFEIKSGVQPDSKSVTVRTRSLLSLMSYMSNYVNAPSGHSSYMWPSDAYEEPEPLMRIHSGTSRPAAAEPAISYRGHWFYLRPDDLRSRNTLFLIRLLYNLQAQVGTDGEGIQLSLPVR